MLDLSSFDNTDFDRGASRLTELLWMGLCGLLFSTWLPGSGWRVRMLKLFGADVGANVVVKPSVQVKFPWRLAVGENAWIGEHVWIDNLAPVSIGANACVSQGVYICTGSHDFSSPRFELLVKPVTIGAGAWVTACCRLAPGTHVPDHCMTRFASIVTAKTDFSNQAQDVRAGEPDE